MSHPSGESNDGALRQLSKATESALYNIAIAVPDIVVDLATIAAGRWLVRGKKGLLIPQWPISNMASVQQGEAAIRRH